MSYRILVSNDDGVGSEGIIALKEAMAELGEVFIVAPDRDQSAVSHSLSLNRPLRMEKVGPNTYSVDGTPTDCINLAINGLLKDHKPDLVVSGINIGENLCEDVTYSGTVSAAMEGTLLGIPSLALSLAAKSDLHFDTAKHYALRMAKKILKISLPDGVMLNVNIPNLPLEQIKGLRITKQGKRVYGEEIVEKTDPRGRPYYWIGGNELGFKDIKDSDIVCVKNGYISVTPIKLDLTSYDYLDILRITLEKLKGDV